MRNSLLIFVMAMMMCPLSYVDTAFANKPVSKPVQKNEPKREIIGYYTSSDDVLIPLSFCRKTNQNKKLCVTQVLSKQQKTDHICFDADMNHDKHKMKSHTCFKKKDICIVYKNVKKPQCIISSIVVNSYAGRQSYKRGDIIRIFHRKTVLGPYYLAGFDKTRYSKHTSCFIIYMASRKNLLREKWQEYRSFCEKNINLTIYRK